jgi:N-ethylmaleimide reductase
MNGIATSGSAGFDTELSSGRADLVAFGAPFISNPDLVDRLKTGAVLAEADSATFYGGDRRGYTDYPALG